MKKNKQNKRENVNCPWPAKNICFCRHFDLAERKTSSSVVDRSSQVGSKKKFIHKMKLENSI